LAPLIVTRLNTIAKEDLEFYWDCKLDQRRTVREQWLTKLRHHSKTALKGLGLDVIKMFMEAIK